MSDEKEYIILFKDKEINSLLSPIVIKTTVTVTADIKKLAVAAREGCVGKILEEVLLHDKGFFMKTIEKYGKKPIKKKEKKAEIRC